MDIEKALASDEGKAAIKKLVEKEVEGLKSKNEELLGSLKKEKDNNKSLEERLDKIEEEKKEAEEQAALKSGDVEKIRQQLEDKFTKQIEKIKAEKDELQKEKEGVTSKMTQSIVDRDLADALNEVGVISTEDARTLIKAGHEIEIGDDGATIEGKPIKEFVSQWAQGDQGKRYKKAPDNGGGGANGANGKGKANTGKADLTGSKKDRVSAIKEKFPELTEKE